jgi:hypothetical protein
MAIGDAVAVIMGTATTNRQPASGVEEQISSIVKHGTTDDVLLWDGSVQANLFEPAVDLAEPQGNAGATRNMPFNMALMITNSVYLRKGGSTDRIYAGGVQTNA